MVAFVEDEQERARVDEPIDELSAAGCEFVEEAAGRLPLLVEDRQRFLGRSGR